MMTKDKLAELQQQGLKAVGAARAIYDAAEAAGRQMSPSEQADYDREMAAAQDWLKQIRTARDDLAVIEKAQEISDAIGGMPGSPLGPTPAGSKDRRLTFAGMGAAAAMKIPDSAPNVKALATGGTVVTGQTFTADPVALGRPATSILDVLPVTTQASDQFAYLRQSVRTNNAAITPEGQVKPTSIYTVTRIEDRLDVVAHLSEAIPRFWIVDNVALEQFLSIELEYGLSLAVQAMVVSDVAGTSGVQTQAFSTSVLQTIRKSLTKLESTGYVPSSIWVNPNDFEGIELALSTVNAWSTCRCRSTRRPEDCGAPPWWCPPRSPPAPPTAWPPARSG